MGFAIDIGEKLMSNVFDRGFKEMVGTTRKFFKNCLIFSNGYATKARFSSSAARSDEEVTNCKFREIVGRFNAVIALQIKLVFP